MHQCRITIRNEQLSVALDLGPLRPNPAGVGTYVKSLALGLAEIGRTDVSYFGVRPDAPTLPAGVPIFRRSAIPYPAWVELFGSRDAARTGAGVVHFTDGLVPLLRPRRRTVVTVLDLSLIRAWRTHRPVRYARIPLVLLAPHQADVVVAISRATADDLMRIARVPARKIHVIPLAPRVSSEPSDSETVLTTATKYGLQPRRYVLVPGTIEPRKNHVRVIAAFEDAVRRRGIDGDIALVFVGQVGWKASATLKAMAASSLKGRIRRLGYVPDADLQALMTGASAVAFVSTAEGFGLPVLEAMACGSPVVTSNVSSMPEVAGDAGILVDPLDVSSIAAGLEAAMRAGDLHRSKVRDHAATFTWAATAAATASLYD